MAKTNYDPAGPGSFGRNPICFGGYLDPNIPISRCDGCSVRTNCRVTSLRAAPEAAGIGDPRAPIAIPPETPVPVVEMTRGLVGYENLGAPTKAASDGSTARYYELPAGAAQLQDLISHRNMNAQDGEIFRAIYRKGHCPHSSLLREAKKTLFYAQAEVDRLEKLEAPK